MLLPDLLVRLQPLDCLLFLLCLVLWVLRLEEVEVEVEEEVEAEDEEADDKLGDLSGSLLR